MNIGLLVATGKDHDAQISEMVYNEGKSGKDIV